MKSKLSSSTLILSASLRSSWGFILCLCFQSNQQQPPGTPTQIKKAVQHHDFVVTGGAVDALVGDEEALPRVQRDARER